MIVRKFLAVDPHDNHNKVWIMEYDEATGIMTTKNGRVGSNLVTNKPKQMTPSEIDTLIRDKYRKGYTEVHLNQRPVVSGDTTLPQSIREMIDMLRYEAGEAAKTSFAVDANDLSRDQINRGLRCIEHSQKPGADIAACALEYVRTIPTPLSRTITPQEITETFVRNIDMYQGSLLSALANLNTTPVAGNSLSEFVNTSIQMYNGDQQRIDHLRRTLPSQVRILNIFEINIASERAAYEAEETGKSKILQLYHGTRSRNGRYILNSGLIIPATAANGSRFGRGIYFADIAKRSYNYGGGRNNVRILFLCDVKVGNECRLPGDDSSLRKAPTGFDSVRGVQSYSGMDEIIVYSPSQQTIKGMALVEGY